MPGLFSFLFLLSILALFLGLIRPKTFGSSMTRKKAFALFCFSAFVCLFMVGVTAEDSEDSSKVSGSASSQSTQVAERKPQESEALIWQSRIEDIDSKMIRKLVEQEILNIKSPSMLFVEAKDHLENNRLEAANILINTILRKHPDSEEARDAKALLISMSKEHPEWIEQSKKKREQQAAEAQRQKQQKIAFCEQLLII